MQLFPRHFLSLGLAAVVFSTTTRPDYNEGKHSAKIIKKLQFHIMEKDTRNGEGVARLLVVTGFNLVQTF